jgi:acetylglutamate kinase
LTTKLDNSLRRELIVLGKPYTLVITPNGLALTPKGRRKGYELAWVDLVSGDAALAVALNAEKLILLTDIRGLLRDPKDEDTLINVVHTYDVPKLMEEGVISGGMIPKMECCVDAIHGGVDRVHILDGRIPHSILIELLSDKGIGTMMIREED